MVKKILILFLLCSVLIANAQDKEANIWYFGDNIGMDFNSGTPLLLNDSNMATLEGSASISDTSGNLLFYSNGESVWNKNHEIMQNGTMLLGSFSTVQSAVIVPHPEILNIYFLFTLDSYDNIQNNNGLNYSIIDINQDNGLGAVVNKNIPLINPASEGMSAVRHANGKDIWVVVHGINNNEFYSFLITGNGVNTTPVVSNIGRITDLDLRSIKISPNGKKLATTIINYGIELFDFNATNGTINNPKRVSSIGFYGIEFSPSNKLLYTGSYDSVFQYNIESNDDIQSTEKRILENLGQKGQIQLGPDKKIYFTYVSNPFQVTKKLGVINNPNLIGKDSNPGEIIIPPSFGAPKFGLPSFIQSFLYNISITYTSDCIGDETSFFLDNIADSVIWNFGDVDSNTNNISTELEPKHIFSSPGTYTVTVNATYGRISKRDEIEVIIYDFPVSNEVELKQLDENADGYTSFNLEDAYENISPNFLNESISFYESLENALTETNPIINISNYINEIKDFDSIWARIVNEACFVTSKVNLRVTKLKFPKYFTPNNDGYNDTWKIEGINEGFHQGISISIYDRYGKLLKQINSLNGEWNGTFNGTPLPPSDYWYTTKITDTEGNINYKKGYFSLIR